MKVAVVDIIGFRLGLRLQESRGNQHTTKLRFRSRDRIGMRSGKSVISTSPVVRANLSVPRRLALSPTMADSTSRIPTTAGSTRSSPSTRRLVRPRALAAAAAGMPTEMHRPITDLPDVLTIGSQPSNPLGRRPLMNDIRPRGLLPGALVAVRMMPGMSTRRPRQSRDRDKDPARCLLLRGVCTRTECAISTQARSPPRLLRRQGRRVSTPIG